jgi:hypothetical protein
MTFKRPKNGQGGMFEQSTDPFLVLSNGVDALSKWLDTSSTPTIFKERNSSNTAWNVVGSPGDKSFAFVQSSALSTWNITHSLGKFPAVTVVDSAGTEVYGSCHHVDANSLILNFSAPFSGTAYCN